MSVKLSFIGFGLIGASVAKALKAKKPGEYEIFVYDYHTEENPVIARAINDGVVDGSSKELGIVFETDIIFLCAPTLKNISYLSKLKDYAAEHSLALPLITDVGSVKGNIVSAAAELGLSDRFIGGHPMAGSEKTGYDSATDHLLENAYYILTPCADNSEDDIAILRKTVTDTGAMNVVLDAATHDRVTAAISHIPHIAAAALVNLVQDSGDDVALMKMLAAGGFKDITRIASSSPEMWESILLSNREAIIDTLERYQDLLVHLEAAVAMSDGKFINDSFSRAGAFRRDIPDIRGMLAPSYRFYVDVEDKTGVIATIAALLSESGVSIKNIGIVHNRNHEQGALRVEFYSSADMEKAHNIMEENKYRVELPK